MEGGYINEVDSVLSDEEGGQLKSKNGQKYIINHRNDGFFITKKHAILIGILSAIVLAAMFLLLYFLLAHSCQKGVADGPESLQQASVFGSLGSIQPKPTAAPEEPRNLQLSEGWSPSLYKLKMQPHISNGTCSGLVVIDITKDSDTAEVPIVLDINNITISQAQVFQTTPVLTSPLNISTEYGENRDTYIIRIKGKPIAANETLQVKLKFISQLSNTLQGFYRVAYEDDDSNTKKWLTSTQFSPIDARRAFPCFDRPDKKARFQISLIREESKTMALSNMPSSFVTYSHAGHIEEDFDVTPEMSTYLVAFMISDLVNTNASRGVQQPASLPSINIWTRSNVADMTNYAYNVTTKVLPFYERYFGINFKLPKIDMVAVPEFGFSAMENWGLITFRESALLVPDEKEKQSSAEHTISVTSIIAHELAHQWFGNLATMKWWDDLWLKEGFANYMSYVALDEIEPKWERADYFAVDELQAAMSKDSDATTHPISFSVSTPADIRRMFDPISYKKGSSIIRMMHSFLGTNAFKAGLTEYLTKFSYKNAKQDDLWEIMTKHGHEHGTLLPNMDVKTIMDSWTIQRGYPVISVQRNGTSIKLTQQRFYLPKINPNDHSRWYIPITFETQANRTQITTPTHWMAKTDSIVLNDVVDPEHWFYLNIRRTGYYRVTYDRVSWVNLLRKYNELPATALAQLLDDSLNLARDEIIAYEIPLTFLLQLRGQDVLPWAAAMSGISYLNNMLNREPAFEHFRALMRYIVRPIFLELGFEDLPHETPVQLMHRQRIVELACFYNYDACTLKAQVLYREWMTNKANNLISPNLKKVVYCTTLREGTPSEWYFAYNRYLETTIASEKEIILHALGCTTKPWLLSKYLNKTISSTSGIRKQDGALAFSSVARNNVGYEIAFDFLVSNIERINEYYGDGFQTVARMIESLTTFMNKSYQKEEFERFVEKANKLGLTAIKHSIELAIERVKNNIHWRSNAYNDLQKFLEMLTRDMHINIY